MEFEYMWRSPVRLSTMLYIACRYALPANILYLLAITDNLHGRPNCDTWYKMIGALSVIGRIAIIFVWSGRNGAIYYPKNRWVLAICGTLGTICIILDILHVPGLRCSKSSSNPIAAELLSILMAVFEFTSAGLMAIRGIQELRDCHSSISSKRSLEYLLYEQVFLFTTASVVLNYAHGIITACPRKSACMCVILITYTSLQGGFLQRLLDAFTLP
ncbi:hypothetical protein BD779DRAFT_1559488 [Infundibulicybe gibba]|nr:hypothetical protein BD779DRAFT_1559488 [Infundibulicybe gibba]